jgi:hydroxyacylglutathione hydrolase
MSPVIRTIRLGGVNCYLVAAVDGFILIDSGTPEKRKALDAQLENAGCGHGTLRLLVLTHGDYDHAGNAAYLRAKYDTKIAMHPDDSGRVERADWSWNLKPKPDKFGFLFRIVALFIRPGEFDTFEPDVLLEDQQSLSGYGLEATILHLPGHTKGSIGILTADKALFCGDLMDSMGRPSLEFFIDDLAAATASLKKLRSLETDWIYPGHGKPFRLSQVAENR